MYTCMQSVAKHIFSALMHAHVAVACVKHYMLAQLDNCRCSQSILKRLGLDQDTFRSTTETHECVMVLEL